MAEDVLVSVVVPTYNGAGTVDATVSSARAQTHRNLEILVVDDGSQDESVARAERHAAEDPRVRVLCKPNGGVADARNFGARASRGAFIAPLDADDLWHPTKIEKQLGAFEAGDPATTCVSCLSHLIDEDDRVIGAVGFDGFDGDVFLRSLVFNYVGNGSVLLIRREAMDRIGGFDVSAQAARITGSEDLLAQSLLAALGPVATVPERLVGYRRSSTQMSSNRERMERAQKWHVDRVKAAIPDAPDDLIAAAVAGVDGRMVVELARRGAVGAALGSARAGLRVAPAHTLAVMASYGGRAARRMLRRLGGGAQARPGPSFFDADTNSGASWVEPLPFPGRLRAIAAREGDFAARIRPRLRADGFAGVAPLGLGAAEQ